MPTIVLRRDAQNDLRSIDVFSRERFGDDVTEAYMADIASAFQRLTEYPEIGAAVSYRKALMRSLSVGRHRIFYYFDNRRVIVVRILHQAMNVPKHLKT
jgi:toxin ParE1/3/4